MILTPSIKHFLFTISFVILLFFNMNGFAQFSYKVEGIVKHNGKPISGADVIITNSAGTEKELVTNSSGTYSYSLQPNDEYSISISKVGFTQFQIIYSTMGLSADVAKKFKGVSKPESELFELPSDQATILKLNAILDKPLLSFYYNSEKNTIDSDEHLEQSLTTELAKVAKLSGGQSSTIETNYKNAIARGDAAILSKNYDLAKSSYNEAISAKPTEQYPKTKLADIEKFIADAEAKIKADAAEKERLAKEKTLADAAAKEKAEKDKALADAATKDKAQKDRAIADAAAKEKAEKEKALTDANEKQRLEKEKILAEAKEKLLAEQTEKDRLTKEKADKDKALANAAETERLLKEKEKADAIAKAKAEQDKAVADLAEKAAIEKAEKDKLAKEKIDKDKALADIAEAERLAKEKAKADIIAKAKADEAKAIADLLEKDRLAKEAEIELVQTKYNNALTKGDSALSTKNYSLAKSEYTNASVLKPKETVPAAKIKEVDALMEFEKRSQYTNELAKKYPQGITEEVVKEGNVKITRRIVVQGNKGNLYVKKETGFGAVYYFKDDVAISETEFVKNTEGVK